MNIKLKDERGFVCYSTEPMILVAIVGILAAIAIPQFARLIRLSNEAAGSGNLGLIRSSLSLYHVEHDKKYPLRLEELTAGGRYLSEIPKARTPGHHPDSAAVKPARSAAELDDRGGWAYAADPSSPDRGHVWVNCTHTDSKGSAWSGY